MHLTNTKRLLLLEAALKQGKIPTIREPLFGAEDLLIAYGLRPGIDVYVPNQWDSKEQQQEARRKLRQNRNYRKSKL